MAPRGNSIDGRGVRWGTNQFVGENEQKKKKELSTEKQIVQ